MPLFGYKNLADFREKAGYDIDGQWYPRVTSIVSVKSKPGLLYYYGEQKDFQTAREQINQAAEEGTLVHDTVEGLLRGEDIEIPSLIRPLIEEFLAFREKNEIVPLLIEERVKSDEHNYAGTLDLLARVNGVLGVVDIKTSMAVYRDYNIQTSAYVKALEEGGFENLERWILRLDQQRTCLLCGAKLRLKGGNKKIRRAKKGCDHQWGPMTGESQLKKLKDIDHDFEAFMACKDLWAWENHSYLRRINEA